MLHQVQEEKVQVLEKDGGDAEDESQPSQDLLHCQHLPAKTKVRWWC